MNKAGLILSMVVFLGLTSEARARSTDEYFTYREMKKTAVDEQPTETTAKDSQTAASGSQRSVAGSQNQAPQPKTTESDQSTSR